MQTTTQNPQITSKNNFFEYEDRVKWWNEATNNFEYGTFHRYGEGTAIVSSDKSGLRFIEPNSLLHASDFGIMI